MLEQQDRAHQQIYVYASQNLRYDFEFYQVVFIKLSISKRSRELLNKYCKL